MDKTKRSPDLTDLVGGYGRWQRDIFIFIFFAAFPNSWQNLAVSFFSPEVDHWCARSSINISVEMWKNTSIPLELINGNYKHSSCLVYTNQYRNKTKECKKWEYDTSVFTSTIINQWDLVCKKAWYVSFSQSIYMTGFMISEIIFGQLSDKLGRRPVMLICIALSFVAGMICAFSVSFLMYVTCRFFVAMGVSGLFTSTFVILMEIVGPEYRAIFGIAREFGWATGYILLSCLAWLIKDSFYLQLTLSIPVILLGICWWGIPESPRWLLSQDRVKECEEILIKAALKNGKSIDNISSEIKKFRKVTEKEHNEKTKKYNLLDLLKYPNMRKKTLNLCFNWCVTAFVYYALSLNTNVLDGGNIFITFFISGAVEFPAFILTIFVLKYVGSKRPLIVTMIIGGLACILTIPIPDDFLWLAITLSMIGKFCIAASFAIIYVYSAEIYPTVVRNVGIGTSSTAGRIGSISAPFVKELGKATYVSVPFIIYGVVSIISGALVILLPETHNKPVPDIIEELEEVTKKSSKNKNKKIRYTINRGQKRLFVLYDC